jgi:hypothetical protein
MEASQRGIGVRISGNSVSCAVEGYSGGRGGRVSLYAVAGQGLAHDAKSCEWATRSCRNSPAPSELQQQSERKPLRRKGMATSESWEGGVNMLVQHHGCGKRA